MRCRTAAGRFARCRPGSRLAGLGTGPPTRAFPFEIILDYGATASDVDRKPWHAIRLDDRGDLMVYVLGGSADDAMEIAEEFGQKARWGVREEDVTPIPLRHIRDLDAVKRQAREMIRRDVRTTADRRKLRS